MGSVEISKHICHPSIIPLPTSTPLHISIEIHHTNLFYFSSLDTLLYQLVHIYLPIQVIVKKKKLKDSAEKPSGSCNLNKIQLRYTNLGIYIYTVR
jgi:hypothetical protein